MKITQFFVMLLLLASCNSSSTKKKSKARNEKQKTEAVSNSKEIGESTAVETVNITPKLFSPKKAQSVTFAADKQTIQTFKEGTRITIAAGSFVRKKDGQPAKSAIRLEVTEYYKLADILRAGLSTMSGNKLLETGGMLYVKAYEGKDELKLAEGRSIKIEFASKESKKDDMQIFNGKVDPKTGVDWVVQPNLYLITEADENEPVSMPDEPAEFPGGNKALMKFLNENVRYPEDALANGVTGRVYLQFVVEANGKIGEISVQRGVSPSIDKEAIIAVSSMPDWKPAKNKGKTVRSYFNMPIKFDISGEDVPAKSKSARTPAQIETANRHYERYQKSSAGVSDRVLNATKLEWINCDRFLKDKETVAFAYESWKINPSIINVVYRSTNTVQVFLRSIADSQYRKVLLGEKATIFALGEKDGKQYVCIKDVVLSSKPVELIFKEYDPEKIDELISQLKWK